METNQIIIYVTGTAGAGKSYLTMSFVEWLKIKRIDCIAVNLDPGADFVPYPADVDIRERFTIEDIMQRYNVGPNGAQIIGADLVTAMIDEIKEEIEYSSAEYVVIDTPGQMELFTLRESSRILIDALGAERSVMIFLFDPIVSKTPSGFLSLLFMSSSAVFRLNLPQIQVLSKVDVLDEEEVRRIIEWSQNPDSLYEHLAKERNLSLELFHMLKESGFFRPLIPVSAVTGFGMEDIYDGIQEIFYGGDDLERILF